MDKKKRIGIQSVSALLHNANFKGFFTGELYTGALKHVCVPGLNCYSCPGAVGACPLGSLQSFLGGLRFRFPYYVVGLLLFFGALLGRAVCGLLCPFGFLQELLHTIPFPKKIRSFRGDKALRKLKYLVLLLLLVLPLFIKLTPFFCKYLCPAGTLAGSLLGAADESIRSLFGPLFTWKAAILLAVLLGSIVLFRPFCKYLCPLGAIYAFFNRVALYGLRIDKDACIHCGACERSCPMGVDPAREPDSGECIRCGRCVGSCPKSCLHAGFSLAAKPHSDSHPER